jgi:hypothetical protein
MRPALKLFWFVIVAAILAGCSALGGRAEMGNERATPENTSSPSAVPGTADSELQDLGPAPELENEVWLNVERPLRLADLRGKVVLLDMWSYG